MVEGVNNRTAAGEPDQRDRLIAPASAGRIRTMLLHRRSRIAAATACGRDVR